MCLRALGSTANTYSDLEGNAGIPNWLRTAKLQDFLCQNEEVALFGSGVREEGAGVRKGPAGALGCGGKEEDLPLGRSCGEQGANLQ